MAAEKKQQAMPYRTIGGTGLVVSALSFGFWATYGVKEGVERCVKVLKICRQNDINFFDNAETYGKNPGDAEIIMGQAIKQLQEEDPKLWRRSDIVLSTKIFWGGPGQNERGLSRKHVREAMDQCLERLQVDYVDLVFCHRFDLLTPIEEVVRGFTDLINKGKALYWGTSEWTADQIVEAYWVAKMHNLIPPVVEQPQYNLFHRENVEKSLARLYKPPYSIGTTIWSPLKSGILTGKYNKEIPEGSRLAQKGYEFLLKQFDQDKSDKIMKVQKLMEVAKKLDTSVTCLSIAWCLKNKGVSTVLLGATKEHQIEENIRSLEVIEKLTPEIMAEIDEIMGNKPAPPLPWGRVID